jgi:hypothetical protein
MPVLLLAIPAISALKNLRDLCLLSACWCLLAEGQQFGTKQ